MHESADEIGGGGNLDDQGLRAINRKIQRSREQLGSLAYQACLEQSNLPIGDNSLEDTKGHIEFSSHVSPKQEKAETLDSPILPIAVKLLEDYPLTYQERRFLVRHCPLPLLQTLVSRRSPSRLAPSAQPVILIKVAEELKSHDLHTARSRIRNRIRTIDASVESKRPIALAIDHWADLHPRDFPILQAIITTEGLGNRYYLLGPSTKELRQLTVACPELSLSCIFTLLTSIGIKQLYGGWDEELFWEATSRDFCIAVGHPLHLQTKTDPAQILDDVIEKLIVLREIGEGCIPIWYPVPLMSPRQLTGEQMLTTLKAIALAKLLLTETAIIRAPLSYFGPELTKLALVAGANDIGLLALDRETKMGLDITLASSAKDFSLPFRFNL